MDLKNTRRLKLSNFNESFFSREYIFKFQLKNRLYPSIIILLGNVFKN